MRSDSSSLGACFRRARPRAAFLRSWFCWPRAKRCFSSGVVVLRGLIGTDFLVAGSRDTFVLFLSVRVGGVEGG